MNSNIEINEKDSRALLVGVDCRSNDDVEAMLDELERLADTAGIVTVGKVIQNRQNPDPATYIGSGKAEEWLEKFKERENVLLFFMFLFPGFPDDLLCSLAGILPITWGGFFAMQLVTRATSIGATALFLSGEVIPYEGWGIIVLGTVGVIGLIAFIVCFKNAARLNAYFTALLQRISRWRIFGFTQRIKTKMDQLDQK